MEPANPSQLPESANLSEESTLPKLGPGRHVVVSEFGESPEDAIARCVHLEPQPVPAATADSAPLAADEVLVAVRSASVGWVDLLMSSGQYQHMAAPPYTPGLEYAGVVAAVGSTARAPQLAAFGGAVGDGRVRQGQPVLIDPFLAGPRSLGAYQKAGGWASWVVVPAAALLPIAGALDFDQACNLLGNYETAYHCLLTRGRLQAGETVLIHGASGSTGLAAVQIAKLVGATVIATGRSADKLAVVKAHGADHVLALSEAEGGLASLRDRVKALTGGRGVEVVYDGVGGPISAESLRCVAFGARFLIVGWAATPLVAKGKGGRGAPNVNLLPTNLVLMKSVDVLGCPTAIATAHDPSIRAPRLRQVLAWAAEGKITPHVSHRFPLDDIHAAMRAKWTGEVVGGCVVHPPSAT
jgi:NADPH:quinone reductase